MTPLLQEIVALLAITNPLGAVPVFLAITERCRGRAFAEPWRSRSFLVWRSLQDARRSSFPSSRLVKTRLRNPSHTGAFISAA
jgi:hypothetical protein